MSGGHFDYNQYRIKDIVDSIQVELDRMGTEIPKESNSWIYGDLNNSENYPTYSDETIKEFKKAIQILQMAEVYATRIDWFLEGDDGEETFHKRLAEDLEKIENISLEKCKCDSNCKCK